MSKQTHSNAHHPTHLADDAKALVAATAHLAEEKVIEARNRVSATLESAREMAGRVRDQAVQGAKATDQAVRKHPYQALAIGFGIGALLGLYLARRRPRDDE